MSTAYEIVRALYSLEMPCNGLLLWVVSLTFGRSSMRPTVGFFFPSPNSLSAQAKQSLQTPSDKGSPPSDPSP